MNKLKGILYDLVLYTAVLGFRKKATGKKLLIVRVDEIGDYILWRAFIAETLAAEKYKDYQFHFCGNQSWKSIFLCVDASPFEKIVWFDKTRFKKKPAYRFAFLKAIYTEGYDTVINPTFSRDKRNDDSIVASAKAKHRIGMVPNTESVRSYEKGYDRCLYTQLFVHPDKPLFEFYRNRLFSAFVSGKPSSVKNTKIDMDLLPPFSVDAAGDYFVIFPGSRSASRIWPAACFVRLANFIWEQYGWVAVVCGTRNDATYTKAFCEQYKNPLIDLTGKTSLTDMLVLFSKARCLLSVDTGSVHLAASAGCTVFGIFNGSQYKRFAPYPSEVATDFYAVYPDEVEKELQDPEMIRTRYEFVVPIPYSSVQPEKVIYRVHEHFRAR